jgi:phosphoribosylformylglycinamidine synthase
LPNYENLIEVFDYIHQGIQDKKIVSVKTIKDGGVAVAVAKMSFGNLLGAEISIDEKFLLEKNIGGLVIESTEKLDSDLLQLIGEVKNSNIIKINNLDFKSINYLKLILEHLKIYFQLKKRKEFKLILMKI